MPSFPDLPGRLSDGRIELRLGSEWDIPDILIAHQDDPALHVQLGLARPPSGAELGRACERAVAERANGTRLELTVLVPGEDTCRGRIDVHRVDWSAGSAHLGIWLAPQLRGRGLAAAALRLAAGWLFGATPLRTLVVVADPDDGSLRRAARAAGFRPQGGDPDLRRLVLGTGDLTHG